MRARLALAAWLVLIALVPWNPALAADVVLGGEVVFRLEDEAQVTALNRRLDELMQSGSSVWAIRVTKEEGKSSLFWGDNLLVTITAEMAKANSSTPQALAELWAENLRKVVKRGVLRVDRERIELPVGGEQAIRVTGVAKGPLEALPASPGLKAEVDEAAGVVTVRGVAVGRTSVEIKRGSGRQVVWVHVKDWAGTLPGVLEVQVTGKPAPGSLVAVASLSAAATSATVNPGCRLQLETGGLDLPSVPAGDTMKFTLPVGISGSDDYFPVHGSVQVVVQNLPLEPQESNLLLVSNRPERVSQDGVLLEYTFKRKEPTRLMYSHLNESPGRRNLWVNCSNPGDQPVRLLLASTETL